MSQHTRFTAASDLSMTQKWLSEVRNPTASGIAKLSSILPRMANHPHMSSTGVRMVQMMQPANPSHALLVSGLLALVMNEPKHMVWFYPLLTNPLWKPILDQHRKRIQKATWLAYTTDENPEALRACLFRQALSTEDIQHYWTQQGFKFNYEIEVLPSAKYESWLTQTSSVKDPAIIPLPTLLGEEHLHIDLNKIKQVHLLFAAAFKDGPVLESRKLMKKWPLLRDEMVLAALIHNKLDGEWLHIINHNHPQCVPTPIWFGLMQRAIDSHIQKHGYATLKKELICYEQWWPDEFAWITGLRHLEHHLEDTSQPSFNKVTHSYDVKTFSDAGTRLYAQWNEYIKIKQGNYHTAMDMFSSEL